METLKYKTGKLMGLMLVCGLGAALFMFLLLYPESVAHIRRARIFATDFGHYFLAPVLVLTCTIAAWRTALVSVGDRAAVEATPNHLVLTSLWRTQRIAWHAIADVAIRRGGTRGAKTFELVVRHNSGNALVDAKLALDTTELHEARYQDFVDTLTGLVAQRGSGGGVRPEAGERRSFTQPARPAAEPEPAFDADAALARYLARKAAETAEAPAAPTAPARPVFGRKGL